MSALILVADSDPFNLRLLQEACEDRGDRVTTSGDGGEVLDVVARERPDLIVIDGALSGIDAFEVLRILKSDPKLATIPVILVTAASDVDGRRRAIELGAEDYITKPYLVFEVQQRIRNTLLATRGSDEAHSEGEAPVGTAKQLAITLDYEFTRAVRYQHPLACVVARVTNHEALTDAAGLQWRQWVGRTLRGCLRATDQVYTSRSDEFALVLPETDPHGARVVLDRVRARLGDPGPDLPVAPKVIGGAAVYPEHVADNGLGLLAFARRLIKDR